MHPDQQALFDWLARHDAPCPICQYNLRGVVTARCPECGGEIHLAVGSENSRIGAWLLALGAITMALGFNLVVCVTMLVASLIHGPPRSRGAATVIFTFPSLTVVSAVALVVVFRRKRRWLLLPRRTQWSAAWGVFAGVAAIHTFVGLWLSGLI